MSLPKRLYDLYRELLASELVTGKTPTDENMLAFASLLNQCNPTTDEETAERNIVRAMYYSNPVGFIKYISLARNRVNALVLYTESKCVAKMFNLKGSVHIKWDETTNTYSVTKYVPRELRPDYVPSPQDLPENKDNVLNVPQRKPRAGKYKTPSELKGKTKYKTKNTLAGKTKYMGRSKNTIDESLPNTSN